MGTRQGPFHATFALPAKSATSKNTNFALDGHYHFMKPSWVRAHGLISGKVYMVWVCAPRYSPLSSPRGRIRDNTGLKIGRIFVACLKKGFVYVLFIFCAYIVHVLYMLYIFDMFVYALHICCVYFPKQRLRWRAL